MNLQPIFFSIAVFASTFLGGLFAIKFRDKLHYIMAFSAGVLLAVVAFDIFPEIIEEVNGGSIKSIWVMVSLICGFLLFHILEKTILIHHAHEGDYADHKHPQVGIFSSLALTGHSFIDGVSIGLGFQISPAVGLLIAIAVMAHAFTDGMNSMTLMLVNKNSTNRSKIFLLMHSLAPVLGAISTMFFTLPSQFLTLYLGFFAGFLLYIGASDILPEAHSERSSYKLIGLTVLGVVFIFVVTKLL
jgi:zinc transporter ZupT